MDDDASLPTTQPITLEEIDRIACRTRPFPLSEEVVPTSTCDFSEIPIETLLNTPPHLIAHLQRTAAQGGFQVVSPRQTPLSAMMSRVKTDRRSLGDHIVGSVADSNSVWPTVHGRDFDRLLIDEPLPPRNVDQTLRKRTKTASLTSALHLLSDPILGCLVKGRAVVDILNRPDVQGDGDGIVLLLADAWGIEPKQLMDLDAFSLGYEGALLRHCIKVDDVFPVMYAPIHQRRSISVGTNEISRENLPADSAMDWRRMRVFCEAVFGLTIGIEGYPLTGLRAYPPPGDMTAPPDRANVMAFMPAPCIAWTHAAATFSLSPVITRRHKVMKTIPPEVLSALARYVHVVKPMSYALAMGHHASTRATSLAEVENPPGETIQSSYHAVSRSVGTHGARGRTAAATVRSYVFEALESAPNAQAMRINRYIQIASSEVLAHLNLHDVPDMIVDKLASKFLSIGEKIRLKVTAEASMRGGTAEEWWMAITSQATQRYKGMKEGTMGWARVGMHLLFKQPTAKWGKLVSAINFHTMRDAAVRSVGGVALPAEKYSYARVEAAARHVAGQVTMTYSSHYLGVSDVGYAISDYLMSIGKPMQAGKIRNAAYLWVLRARVYRAINVTLIPPGGYVKNLHHYFAPGEMVSINLAPAPYRMYSAYRASVMKDETIPKRVKEQLPANVPGKVSEVFKRMKGPIIPIRETELTKYLIQPSKLGDDMEKAWRMMVQDMDWVLTTHASPPSVPIDMDIVPEEKMALANLNLSLAPVEDVPGAERSYWDIVGELSGEGTEQVDRLIDAIGDDEADAIYEETFADANALFRRLQKVDAEIKARRADTTETVR